MRRIVFMIACGLFLAVPQPSFASAEAGRKLALSLEAVNDDDWSSARKIAKTISNPAAQTYVKWRRLRAGSAKWPEYLAFLKDHPDWPGLPLLRRVGEQQIPPGRPTSEILAFFSKDLPQTGTGALRLAEAFETTGHSKSAQDTIRLAWLTLPLNQTARERMLKSYPKTLSKHHWARTDHLIWEGKFDQARAMLPLLSNGQRRLAEARIALRKGQARVGKMIDAIPKSLMDDPGLAYDRFRWRLRRDLWDGGEEILLKVSTSREALGRPSVWSHRRAMISRRAMRAKRYEQAYKMASQHHLKRGENGYIDLEWLSGYLKLIYLKDADAAVAHFRNLRGAGVTPITQGRIWYWLGRGHEAAGNDTKAKEAYEVAARYQTSFYGQLAAARAGLPPQSELADLRMANWKGAPFLASSVFQVGVLLHHADKRYEGGRFFAHLAETLSETDQSKLGQYLLDIRRPNMALRVAKNAARQGRVTIQSYYPVTELAEMSTSDVPPELIMAIARQETELNPDVVSPAGAQGLMQIMPRTAQAVAKSLNMDYSKNRLISDWRYNAQLGVAYLAQLLNRYDGSYVLTAAAYNAGPNRVSRWIKEHGDPRKPGVSAIAWMEKIQFNETRNYVQRVLESTNVYRARISGDPNSFRLQKDINRGG